MTADTMTPAREMLAAEYEAAGYRDEASAFRAGDWTCADHPAVITLHKVLTREAEVRGEERAKVARFIRLYDMWCEGWGMYRNLAAATEAAGEIAAMIDKWDWSVPIPDDDEAAEDHIVRIVQCWYRERNEASIRSDRPAIRSAPSSQRGD